ncbi:hypothetical protein B0H17DRAFT_219445 [Mycena rosella]|uniref:Uncharacterized protein n=1 Tax=Mycena rosella TaxID=1033263 RepID=A0AAD7G567_MYCRO|nr:hypothetical protein B0H17DRAFT_219445 [Mycena rosella]
MTALSLAKISGDSDQECIALNRLATVNSMLGNYPAARSYTDQALVLGRQSGNIHQEAASTTIQAMICTALGQYTRSLDLFDRARKYLDLCGLADGDTDLRILRLKAGVHGWKSEYREARAIYVYVLGKTSPDISPFNYGFTIHEMVTLDIVTGESSQDILKNMDTARQVFSDMHHTHSITLCDTVLGNLKLREGDMSAAKVLLEESFNSLRGYDAEGMLYCLEKLGDVSRWSAHNISFMSNWTVLFLGQALQGKNRLAIHQALQFLGDVAVADGDDATANSLFDVALDGFTQMDVHLSRGICLIRLGDLPQRRGDSQNACDFWKAARPLFVRSSQTRWVEQVNERLIASSDCSELPPLKDAGERKKEGINDATIAY